jgi:hypothetical protein
MSPLTNTCVVRCSRDYHQQVNEYPLELTGLNSLKTLNSSHTFVTRKKSFALTKEGCSLPYTGVVCDHTHNGDQQATGTAAAIKVVRCTLRFHFPCLRRSIYIQAPTHTLL